MKSLFKFAIISLSILITTSVYCQNSDHPKVVSRTILFKNASIVQRPGKVLKASDILIKDGIIVKVTNSISAPYDAYVIDCDSLFIYPSFIDGGSHTGTSAPTKSDKKPKPTDFPTLKQSGITPQQTIAQSFDSKALKDRMEVGFGYVQALPRGRMIAGQGSLMTTDKSNYNELIILENNVMASSFLKSEFRLYPSTTMGVIKMYHDVFANAKNFMKVEANSSGTSLKKPVKEEYKSLYPVVENKMPLYFLASTPHYTLNALKLRESLDVNMILAGVGYATPIIDQLTDSKLPIFLSLKLPKEIGKMDSLPSVKEQELYNRKKATYDSHLLQAQLFEEKGVLFGFSTFGLDAGKIKKNLTRIVEAGVSEEVVLSAITINPAKILGVDQQIGTLEQGKLGNLFISEKPFFDKDSRIKYTYINEKLIEHKADKSKK